MALPPPPYSAVQPTYNAAQQPYSAVQPTYNAGQQPYNAGQPTYNAAQQPYYKPAQPMQQQGYAYPPPTQPYHPPPQSKPAAPPMQSYKHPCQPAQPYPSSHGGQFQHTSHTVKTGSTVVQHSTSVGYGAAGVGGQRNVVSVPGVGIVQSQVGGQTQTQINVPGLNLQTNTSPGGYSAHIRRY